MRVAQVLIALPTGALFFSTGGDDMPILALMLLGVAALQRRQTNLAGVSLGLAAAMKLTAWPMAAGALLVARDPKGRSTWKTGARLGRRDRRRDDRALRLARAARRSWRTSSPSPSGLAGVKSPAASALPGHILTTWLPVLGHVLRPRHVPRRRLLRDPLRPAPLALTLSQLLAHVERGVRRHDLRGVGDAGRLRRSIR